MNDDVVLLLILVVGIPAVVFLGYRLFFWPILVERRLRDLEDKMM